MPELSDYDRWIVARLVHADWYAATYKDTAGEDSLAHFSRVGAATGHDPNPLFSTRWYLARYPDVAASGLNALEHYVGVGARAGYDPGPLFSTCWYQARNPDVVAVGLNPLEHYLEWGPRQRRDPSPVFDSGWYFARYPDAMQDGMDACSHFMQQGARLGYSPCKLFDTSWYRRTYKDVASSGINPLLHYLTVGAAQGRDPGPQFSTRRYLASHPSVAAKRVNPLVHFLAAERLPAGPPPAAMLNRLSEAAIREAASAVAALRSLDPALGRLPDELDTLRLATALPADRASAWRGLYLSLTALPLHVILVGRIDFAYGLAELVQESRGLLVIETDGAEVSVADGLPPGVDWRSLSEFAPGLDPAGRAAVITTLMAALRPDLLTVCGSRAGAEVLALHGPALAPRTRRVSVAPPMEALA